MTKQKWFIVKVVIAIILLNFMIEPVLWFVIDVRDAARRTSSLNNLKQMGLVFAMYRNADEAGNFPPPTPRAARATMDLAVLHLADGFSLSHLCVPAWRRGYEPFELAEVDWPKHIDEAERIVAINHVYFGYAFSSESELNALLDATPRLHALYPGPLERANGPHILSLGEAARLANKKPPEADASKIVVLFENPRLNDGMEDEINILYLDGRAKTVPRKEFFPGARFDRLTADDDWGKGPSS